ncbi:MAG TPA: SDR family oxidoreductase [Burkholderiaceae bacterium]
MTTTPYSSAAADSLRGMTVLITGAASGLGAAVARVLAADGASLAIADLAFDRLPQTAAALAEQGSQALLLPVALDVGDEAQVRRAIEQTCDRFGRLDAVVNSAGIDVTRPIAELSAEDWSRVVRTNLSGPFLVAKHAAAAMLRQPPRDGTAVRGHIVNIASTAAKRAWPNAAAYHASKWGLLGLSHALHAELRPQGIKVAAVVAGGMRTPFLLERFPDIDPQTLQDPAHVAQAVRFVLSQPAETVIPEIMVLPMRESSWP